MQSTPNLRDTDPHDVFVIEPDASLAARADKAPLDLLYDVLSHNSAPRPSDPAPSQVRPDPELRIAPDFSASAAVPSIDAAAPETGAKATPASPPISPPAPRCHRSTPRLAKPSQMTSRSMISGSATPKSARTSRPPA